MSDKKKNVNLSKFKEEFFSEYWVESRHDLLKSLRPEEAKELVETFDDSEVHRNVNSRRYQEDYIGDYLEELWDISKESFWQHIKVSWRHPEGTVIGDHNFHIGIMKTEHVPDDVWAEILNSLTSEESYWMFMDFWHDIIINQTMNLKWKVRRQKQLLEWFSELDEKDKKLAGKRLREIFDNKPPDWLSTLLLPINT